MKMNEIMTEGEGDAKGLPHLTKELLSHIVQQVGSEGAHAIVKSLTWGDGAAKELLHLIVKDLEKDLHMAENFKDGRHPEDKGDSKRYGVPTKSSVSTLRKVAHQGGRKGQLAHWMANMKAGKAKKK